ncbi:MAG TPA: hypothetical protein VK390_09935 [Propionibacteriaceae bacterium]|nr:hypothetical protein [Propionibacteriaceae bacterium]
MTSGKDTLTDTQLVELRESDDFPASILITSPQARSVGDPRQFVVTTTFVRI